jgi:hypothetical protein
MATAAHRWGAVKSVLTLIYWIAVVLTAEYFYATTSWMHAELGEFVEGALIVVLLGFLCFFLGSLRIRPRIEENILFDKDTLVVVTIILIVCEFIIGFRVASIWLGHKHVMPWVFAIGFAAVWNVIYWALDDIFNILPRSGWEIIIDD